MPRFSLRIVVMVVAALAGLKVWAQDRYQRGIFHDALIAAYGEQARTRCQKELAKASPGKWHPRTDALSVTIGNAATDVAVWDVDNPLWEVRYRHPHIMVPASERDQASCAYDIVAGLANLGERPN